MDAPCGLSFAEARSLARMIRTKSFVFSGNFNFTNPVNRTATNRFFYKLREQLTGS